MTKYDIGSSHVKQKEVQCLFDKIYIVENFIHPDTAKYISSYCNLILGDTPHNEFIKGGPANYAVSPINPIMDYSPATHWDQHNIIVDLLTSIGIMMQEMVSMTYNKKFVMQTLFYSAMMPGAENKLHFDNHYLSEDDIIKAKAHNHDDRAALLYLNADYEGGILNFPNQNWSIKPKPGTFIFFEGDETIPHEVTKVTSGIRNNFLSFLYPLEYADRPKTRPIYETEKEMSYDDIKNPEIMARGVDMSQVIK